MDEAQMQQLVELIAEQVIAQISAQTALLPQPKTMALLASPLAKPEAAFKVLGAEYGDNTAYIYNGGFMYYNKLKACALNEGTGQRITEAAAAAERIAVVSPDVAQLAAMAATGGDMMVQLSQRCLLWGKPMDIWLDFAPESLGRGGFFADAAKSLKALKGMGVRIKRLGIDKRDASRHRLLTEEVVLKCAQAGQSEILYEKGAIVTPLARDAAAQHGINIVEG